MFSILTANDIKQRIRKHASCGAFTSTIPPYQTGQTCTYAQNRETQTEDHAKHEQYDVSKLRCRALIMVWRYIYSHVTFDCLHVDYDGIFWKTAGRGSDR